MKLAFPHLTNSSLLPIFFFLIFITAVQPVIDPDFGWHLMAGKSTVENHHAPQTDLFTFSYPDYPYPYHSWLTEVIYYLVFAPFGLLGVTLFISTLIAVGFTLAAAVTLPLLKHKYLIFLLIPLFHPIQVLTGFAVRTQTVSFLLLSLLIYLTQPTKKPQKLFYLTPFFFFLWVNLHGGFIIGLAYLLLHLILTLFLTDPDKPPVIPLKHQFLIFALSFLATFANPYTYRVHQLSFQMLGNQTARAFNQDWLPAIISPNPAIQTSFWIITILTLLTIITTNTSQYHKLLLTLLFIPHFYYPRFTLPLSTALLFSLPPSLEFWFVRFKRQLNFKAPIPAVLTFFLLAYSLLKPTTQNLRNTLCAYTHPACYAKISQGLVDLPFNAITYLKLNPPPPNLLNNINWGGYLVWQLPGTKIYADSKMDNYFPGGKPFLQEYADLFLTKSDWSSYLDQHHINSALLSPDDPLSNKLTSDPNWILTFQDPVSLYYLRRLPL